MDARTEILQRISAAGVCPAPATRPVVGGSLRDRAAVIEQFAEYVAEYKANVVRATPEEVADVVRGRLAGERVVLPPDLPCEWFENCFPDEGLSARELDGFGAVMTLCAVAVAETGTIVLDGGAGQGRRAITLVPDHHVILVPEDRIVDTLPEAVAALAHAARAGRPLTWISGPSATSDIELSRVEGVHGPRLLDVVIVGEARP